MVINLAAAFVLTAVSSHVLNAEVKLPAIFGDNMVLQQQVNAAFWGKASPGSTVTVRTSWNNRTYSARADRDGNWRVKVSTPSAGGPYSVTVSQGNTIIFRNVLIGEVWVCSGQ